MKTVTLKKAAVISNNKLKTKVVADTGKVANYERKRQKRKKVRRKTE